MSNGSPFNRPISPYNTFILNWIENYDEQIQNLTQTLIELNNKVIVYDKLKYKELFSVVDSIRTSNFGIYNYIVIIILDNRSTSGRFIVTAEGTEVLLNTEILTVIQTNETLRDKPRLFVIQKLLDIQSFDQAGAAAANLKVKRRNDRIKINRYYRNLRKRLEKGLTIEIKAQEYTDNYQASPFIETFCNEFRRNATIMPIDKIYSKILQEIKTNQNYKIAIELGSNQSVDDNLIFGTALSAEELRDFFDAS